MRPAAVPADPPDPREMHGFVLELGRMLSLAGTAVSETQERLTAIAAAGGAHDARVVGVPDGADDRVRGLSIYRGLTTASPSLRLRRKVEP